MKRKKSFNEKLGEIYSKNKMIINIVLCAILVIFVISLFVSIRIKQQNFSKKDGVPFNITNIKGIIRSSGQREEKENMDELNIHLNEDLYITLNQDPNISQYLKISKIKYENIELLDQDNKVIDPNTYNVLVGQENKQVKLGTIDEEQNKDNNYVLEFVINEENKQEEKFDKNGIINLISIKFKKGTSIPVGKEDQINYDNNLISKAENSKDVLEYKIKMNVLVSLANGHVYKGSIYINNHDNKKENIGIVVEQNGNDIVNFKRIK